MTNPEGQGPLLARITGTGRWVLGAFGADDAEFEDLWLVGDALTTVARDLLEPLE